MPSLRIYNDSAIQMLRIRRIASEHFRAALPLRGLQWAMLQDPSLGRAVVTFTPKHPTAGWDEP